MQALITFFEGIADAITSAFSFLISIVEDIVYFIGVLGWTIAQVPVYLSWLPGSLLALLTILITVVVVCRVIGRD